MRYALDTKVQRLGHNLPLWNPLLEDMRAPRFRREGYAIHLKQRGTYISHKNSQNLSEHWEMSARHQSTLLLLGAILISSFLEASGKYFFHSPKRQREGKRQQYILLVYNNNKNCLTWLGITSGRLWILLLSKFQNNLGSLNIHQLCLFSTYRWMQWIGGPG